MSTSNNCLNLSRRLTPTESRNASKNSDKIRKTRRPASAPIENCRSCKSGRWRKRTRTFAMTARVCRLKMILWNGCRTWAKRIVKSVRKVLTRLKKIRNWKTTFKRKGTWQLSITPMEWKWERTSILNNNYRSTIVNERLWAHLRKNLASRLRVSNWASSRNLKTASVLLSWLTRVS